MTETLANGYSSESPQRELSNEYQHDRVWMVFKKICLLVLWMKVVSALEGLKHFGSHIISVYDRCCVLAICHYEMSFPDRGNITRYSLFCVFFFVLFCFSGRGWGGVGNFKEDHYLPDSSSKALYRSMERLASIAHSIVASKSRVILASSYQAPNISRENFS